MKSKGYEMEQDYMMTALWKLAALDFPMKKLDSDEFLNVMIPDNLLPVISKVCWAAWSYINKKEKRYDANPTL